MTPPVGPPQMGRRFFTEQHFLSETVLLRIQPMFGWFWKRIRKIGVFGVEVEFHPPVSGNTSKTNGEKITIADKERIPAAGSLEEQVRAHHDVQRLLNNRSWKATAEAAILELVRGEHCGDATRRSTATWSQVKAIVDELRRQ